jgi:hypothetical protein
MDFFWKLILLVMCILPSGVLNINAVLQAE